MSTTKITSEILKIESPIRDVYALLSDFSRIGRLVEMAKQMGMTNGLEMDKISEKIESTRFTEDACYITLKGMGELAVKIVEKEEPKLIKLGGDGATPFEFNLSHSSFSSTCLSYPNPPSVYPVNEDEDEIGIYGGSKYTKEFFSISFKTSL